jgi:hypothetical protein
MASSRLPGPGRSRATLAFALSCPALFAAACEGEGGADFAPPPEARSCAARGCVTGVRVEAAGVSLPDLGPLPLAFRVCLDARCTDLALRGDPRAPSCEVVGPPPDGQIAHCYAQGPGPLTFDVDSFDGRRPGDSPALVALSARSAEGTLLFHDAAEVRLEPVYANGPACSATCARGSVTFWPAAPPRVEGPPRAPRAETPGPLDRDRP